MKYCKKGDVRFNLKKEKDKKVNLQIFMIFNFEGKRLRYYTGKRIDETKWDVENQKVKLGYYETDGINRHLKFLSSTVEQEYSSAKIKGERVTESNLRRILKEKEHKVKSKSVLDAFLAYLEARKSELAHGTYKKYKTAHSKLNSFSEDTGYLLDFDSIDLTFEEKFRDYLINESELTNNSIAKYFKIIKTFMNYATERGLNKSVEYQKFKVRESEGDVIFLNWDELMTVYKHEFEDDKLDRVRDMFCFCCFTGLRFSDMQNLKPENIDEEFIHIKTLKTRADNFIPLNKFSSAILKKYLREDQERVFPQISNQKMNKYLKDVGKEAELTDKVEIVKFRGAERIDDIVEKHMVLTSHIGRKTFITNALKRGMTREVIMDVTSHNSHKAFKRYYKIVNEHKKSEMIKAFGK